ncbi:MAG: hypothetical protein QOE29_1051 [Gaiellaceae bacterium]|nr:hypothetical protein [Gaiellaceae bacterium]
MDEGWLQRIERDVGLPGLVEALAERLAPTDLRSLLLEVESRRAGARTPAELLRQYATDRFVQPSPGDPLRSLAIEQLAFTLLPAGYEAVDVAPVAPLGTSSVLGTVQQNSVVSTTRGTEVASDATAALALECARRRRRDNQPAVRLAAAQRVTRAQQFDQPDFQAHFRLFALCTAGRDTGNRDFEADALVAQIGFYVRLLTELGGSLLAIDSVRVGVTDLGDGAFAPLLEERVAPALRAAFPGVEIAADPEREARRSYYERVCFRVWVRNAEHDVPIVDGGFTDWTQRLLADRKERLLTSGIGVQLLAERF